jgi:putative aldouronate transport system permease protein
MNPTLAHSSKGKEIPASGISGHLMRRRKRWKQNVPLLVMFAPVIVYFLLFKYVPLGGYIIAFKSYNLTDGILGSPWTGWSNFQLLFENPIMIRIIKNTFIISLLTVVVGFPFPIIAAILLNEVRHTFFKRTVQTFIYLPHFLNWVIVGSFVLLIFAQDHGIVNEIVKRIAGEPYPFLYQKGSWLTIFLGSGIWKEVGFSAIIYLAALTSIDPTLYESASLDGANKWRQIWNITIPGITPVIVLMLVLQMDKVMNVGFDQIFVLTNPTVRDMSDVISTWSYTVGLGRGQFSLTTALGLFQSLIGLVLVLTANQIARKFDKSLW